MTAPDPEILKRHGINAVRVVSREPNLDTRFDVDTYAARCQDAGIFVLAVLTLDSKDHVIDHFDALQIGNEPDGGGIASWRLSEQAYVELWNKHRRLYSKDRFPDRKLITAGLLRPNGNWNWNAVVRNLEPPVDGIARHSYGDPNGPPRTPEQLEFILNDLRAEGRGKPPIDPLPAGHWITSVPLYVTEWHPRANAMQYMADLPGVMQHKQYLKVAGGFFYCWSDEQTDENKETGQEARGLFDHDYTTPKEEYQYFKQALCRPTLRPNEIE